MCNHAKDTKVQDTGALVFINRPITSSDDDIVGFSTQVDTICEAVKEGSTMIGVIADYGAGKSSLTELLCKRVCNKPYQYPEPIKINMWDSLDNKRTEQEAEHEVSRLTKSFLYQLACGNGKGGIFSSYINHRLSRNYGNISFSVGSGRFWVSFAFAALFYVVYLIGKNDSADFATVLQPGMILSISMWLKTLYPVALVLAGIALIVGVVNSCIVFSHWKMQGTRETEVNDVFDIYSRIIQHIKPKGKKKKQIIVIEDLDRIRDKDVIVGFIKEIYRFQNATQKLAEQFSFVVSIKPESALISSVNQSEDDLNIYSKLFDITVPLKPIHYDDYDSILLQLLNGDPEKKKRLEKLIGESLDGDTLPKSFRWLKLGQNLTVRELKDRLNHAIMIMSSRQNYQVKTAVTFEPCAAVTYLESQYPKNYYTLIQNEKSFAEFMRKSVEIINMPTQDASGEDQMNALKTSFEQIISNKHVYDTNFVSDFCGMVRDGIFNYDFRMYFYTYPSGSHVKTTEERELCDMLLFPNKYNDYSQLGRNVQAVYCESEKNVVTDTLISLADYPRVVLMNQTLLRIACEKDWQMVANSVDSHLITTSLMLKDSTVDFWRCIHEVDFSEKSQLIKAISNKLLERFPQPNNIVVIRSNIIKACGTDIGEFEILYSNVTPNIPLISKEEIELLGDTDTSVSLINENHLSAQDFDYISDLLCAEPLHNEPLEKAKGIMKKFLELLPEGAEDNILTFLNTSICCDDELFAAICGKTDGNRLVAYLNALPEDGFSDQYYSQIEEKGVGPGLSNAILKKLADRDCFKCVLLAVGDSGDYRMLDQERNHTIEIERDCRWLSEKHISIFYRVRRHLCIELSDNRYLPLYQDDFPPIDENDYATFQSTITAIGCINAKAFDETDCKLLQELIGKRNYSANEGLLLLRQLFDTDYCSGAITSSDKLYIRIADCLDYRALQIRSLGMEDREIIYRLISPAFQQLGLDSVEQLRRLDCFVESVEKEISDSDSYPNLFSDLGEITPFGHGWLKENYIHIPLSKELSSKLKESGDYENYIIATVLREQDMVLDDAIPIESYRTVYCNVDEMYNIMSDHWNFLEALQKREHLDVLYESEKRLQLIQPIYKVPQHKEFVSWMVKSGFETAEKEKYLDNINKIATYTDSKEIQEILCAPKAMQLLGARERYYHIWNLFWDSPHKAVFTRRWNECWGDKLGHV